MLWGTSLNALGSYAWATLIITIRESESFGTSYGDFENRQFGDLVLLNEAVLFLSGDIPNIAILVPAFLILVADFLATFKSAS